jgi:hypothetical protein
MSYSTIIPIRNILPPSSLHYTPKPSYKFHIEFVGQGVDAFFGRIPNKKAFRFKDWDQRQLSKLVKLYTADWGTPQGLISEIPNWAREGDHHDYFGIDVSQPFEMTVYDDDGNILYVNDPQAYELVMLPNFVNEPEQDDVAPHLFAKDVYPFRCRFSVDSDKPFDITLIAMDAQPLMDSYIVEEFLYDGQNINGQVLDRPWADDDQREIKIIYN